MKYLFALACLFSLTVIQSSAVMAATVGEVRAEAEQYYQQGDYKNAYKQYLKLAKMGDHPSQEIIAKMYANGEGKKESLVDAYAWSALAAESGKEDYLEFSDNLLARNEDPAKAEKKAEKLIKKYGLETQRRKAEQSANRDPNRCIGSLLGCKKR